MPLVSQRRGTELKQRRDSLAHPARRFRLFCWRRRKLAFLGESVKDERERRSARINRRIWSAANISLLSDALLCIPCLFFLFLRRQVFLHLKPPARRKSADKQSSGLFLASLFAFDPRKGKKNTQKTTPTPKKCKPLQPWRTGDS